MFVRLQSLPHLFCTLILSAAFITYAQGEETKFSEFLREFPTAYTLQGPSSGKAADEQRFNRVYDDLAKRLNLPRALSRSAIPALAEEVSQDIQAPLLDRARADYVLGQYQQAEERALVNGDAAHRDKPRRPTEISLSLHLAALAALERGQNDAALKYIKVAQGEASPLRDLPTWAQIHASLAHIHWRSGRPAEQISTLRLILSEYLKAEGITHPYTLHYHNELAAALYDDHQDAAAEKELREILRLTETNHGPDDAKTVTVRKNLARIIESQDHFDEAEPTRRTIIASQKRTLGVESPVTLRSREQLVKNLFEQRKFTECEAEALGLLELSQRVLGADDLITLSCRLKLAQCQREQDMTAEAETQLRRLRDHESRVLGIDHLETLTTAHELGLCLNTQRKFAEAATELKSVLDARTRLLPADHRDTLDTHSQLGIAYQNTGKLEEAELEYRAVMNALTKQLGPQHPKTVLATQRLTDLMNLPEAKALMISHAKKQLAEAVKAHGTNDTRALNAQLGLAGVLAEQGKQEEAEKEYRQVHSSLTRLLKEETAESVLILRQLATCLLNQNKWPEAETIYRQVLRHQRRLLDPANPEILQSLYLLGLCLGQQKKMDEARPLLEECLDGITKAGNIIPAFVTQVKNVLDQVIQIQRQPKPESGAPAPAMPAPTAAATPTATTQPPQAPSAEMPQTINKPLSLKP